MNNQDIRRTVAAAGLKLWQVANALGMSDGTFSRKLRKELSEKEKQEIRKVIEVLKAGEQHG